MRISSVNALYYSATGNTALVVKALAQALCAELGVGWEVFDYTLPAQRRQFQTFGADQLVLLGTPVYAGRVPNKMLPYLQTMLQGQDTPAVAVVTFGNRGFDNALAELRFELEEHGFRAVGAAALPARHAFTDKLAPGRPNGQDLSALRDFARRLAEKLQAMDALPAESLSVAGTFPAPYYTPLGTDGAPAVFLKAKPKTRKERCTACGLCAQLCPMGSISFEDPAAVEGICIKCHACVRRCPAGAKYFDDPAFLSHLAMLERHFTRPAETAFFL